MESVLRISLVVEKGRVLYRICFTGSTKKHINRSGIEEIKDVVRFK